MKKEYVKPMMVGERFMADEYVAACDDQGVTYDFICNAGDKDGHYDVWLDNGNGKFDRFSDDKLTQSGWYSTYYHPCDETHSVTVPRGTSVKRIFQDGWMRAKDSSRDPQKVIVWTANGTDIHCTSNLNITEWGKNMS